MKYTASSQPSGFTFYHSVMHTKILHFTLELVRVKYASMQFKILQHIAANGK